MTRQPADVEVVVVGGGIAGGSVAAALARAGISVEILERQDDYRDLRRGEALSPWGVHEAERLGVADALFDANPAPLEKWVQWDEVYAPSEAPSVDLMQVSWGARSPYAIRHCETSESFAAAAVAAGAVLRMGVRDLAIQTGDRPVVSYRCEAERVERRCRLIVGAGGRAAPTGRLAGLRQQSVAHHWCGALAVEGLDEWPAGVQAVGTEDRKMFLVFPQNDGLARLYINYPAEDRHLYVGRGGAQRFLQAFDLRCLPLSELLLRARPLSGSYGNVPSWQTWMDEILTPGVVLVGDEAGMNDAVLGTGLANSLRDARIVADLLTAQRDWGMETFRPYVQERAERMRKMHFAAGLLATLNAEFGPAARERRRRALARMRKDPNFMMTLLIWTAGPDRVPDFATSRFFVERLLADEPATGLDAVATGVGVP